MESTGQGMEAVLGHNLLVETDQSCLQGSDPW